MSVAQLRRLVKTLCIDKKVGK